MLNLISIFLTFTQIPPPPVIERDYHATVENLRKTDEDANRDPINSVAALTAAIESLNSFTPELAQDPQSLALRQFARLNLARAHLLDGQPERAAAVMDEAIREAMGAQLPADKLGPSLAELYQDRLVALAAEGRASLVVTCDAPCRVYVDEREVGQDPPPLLLGRYRVWVEDVAGTRETLREELALTQADQTYELVFSALELPVAAPTEPSTKPPRIIPRWASLTLLAAGAAVMAAGGAAIGVGNKSEKVGGMVGGAVVLGIGGAALASGVVSLGVDAYRASHARGHQATLSWAVRF
ncbi:hypothetical protein ENSA5_23700 [Enhygromyxa salina]|uniref:PEGA domain-containing protein n=1 Tax=Enhygromyxa salina TaxID=215803 RepID=A0A2S9YB75_9BACT|nr:hypothetical protein [Enhygromyxa salina]PRQ02353.1 hypothetical protein ENSA5_23700 [Enhygromyxa salina]